MAHRQNNISDRADNFHYSHRMFAALKFMFRVLIIQIWILTTPEVRLQSSMIKLLVRLKFMLMT